ncbi:TIGR02391 family protein [Streptomyces sp. NPDC002742]|uniref:TIGR02391 family protein n=1 Tax=Streptomyces sp. NPDC002742 TaxID=3364663 RepID=UPI0036851B1E
MTDRTIAPEGMPRPSGEHGQALLDLVWQYFADSLCWPTFDYVDRKLYASGLKFEEAVQQLCPALLRGVDAGLWRLPQSATELSLTVAGAANCTRSAFLIDIFLTMVRRAASIEPHFVPEEPGVLPELRPNDVEDLMPAQVELPSIVNRDLVAKQVLFTSYALGRYEPCFRGGNHATDTYDWKLAFDRDIRPFADVRQVDEYWRIREQVLGPTRVEADNTLFHKSPVPDVAPMPKAIPDVLVADVDAAEAMHVTCMLHPLIADVVAERFSSGFFVDAVARAFQAVEHRVQTLVGVSEIGERLMGIAFGAKPGPPQLTVTRSTGSSLESEQNGMQFLFKGATAALRNPRMHGPDAKDARDEAEEMLVFASFLMRRLDIEDDKRKAAAAGP